MGGRWVWCQAGGRLAPGAGVGCGARWAGGGQKKPRQALEARRLRHAERTVLPAVAQSKKGGGGLVGPAWAWAVVGAGVRRVVASAGGERWGARVVSGGVSGAACRRCRVGELDCLRSRAGLWGSVACGGGGCVLLPVSYYEEVMRVKTSWGLRPESLGRGNGALAAGYPRLGWPGCPGGPWGRRLPTLAGCETTACISVTEVLRVLPQELTRPGDCGPGRPRGMIMKRKWGARMSLAVGTFLRPGGGRCPGLLPLPCVRVAVVSGGVVPPNRRPCPVPWAQTPVGGGYEAPGRLALPAQQPARRC